MSLHGQIYDQFGTVIRRVHIEQDGTFHLSTSQDLENVIRENQILRENQTGKENMRLVARMPVHEAEKAMREGWFHDDKAMRRWLNDRDNFHHRVHEGRV